VQKLMSSSHDHPWIVILFLLITSTIAAMQVPSLTIDSSLNGLRMERDNVQNIYQAAIETFGSDKINIVYIKDDSLFTPEKLIQVEKLVVKLEAVKGIQKVESLFSTNNFKNDNGMLVTGPLMEWVPETIKESENLLADARANPIISGNLVSKEETSIAINLFLDTDNSDKNFYQKLTLTTDSLIQPFESEFEKIFQIGEPYLRHQISKMMVIDQKRIIPVSVLVLLITLIVVTRSISCAILPMLTAGTSILWTAAFMALMGIPVNILTMIVPSLILVIGSTEDVHLLMEYQHGLNINNSKNFAIQWMIKKMGVVVMVTALTTFIGFLSICLNNVIILKQFGMVASFALFVNPLITCLITPVYLKLWPYNFRKKKEDARPDSNPTQRAIEWLASFISLNKKIILSLAIILTLIIGGFSFRVKLENNSVSMFKEKASVLHRLNSLTNDFPGVQTFFIRINGGHKDIFKDPKNLREIDAVQTWLDQSGKYDKTVSIIDFLKLINREMNGGNPEKEKLPSTKARIAQYLTFLEDNDIERYVNYDFSDINIMVRHNINSSHDQKYALKDLAREIKTILNPHFSFFITGDGILTLNGADAIADGQAKSIFLLLFIIFIIMSGLFMNLKAGLLSLVPNIIPVVINFGIMGLFSIPLNVGTAMVSVIAIGIAVDDTLHFMTRYNDEMHQVKNQDKAMRICIRTELKVVFATSIALSLGFAVLAFSNFVPIIQFGMLSAVVMLVAFLCDIFVTPILLSNTRLLTLWDILSLKLRKEVIEQSEFFRDMKMRQIKKIVLLARIRKQKKDDLIYEEGEKGDCMYLLLEGNAQRYSIQSTTDKKVRTGFYSPGDIFGHIAVLDNHCFRSANTSAVTDIKFVEISGESLDRLQKLYPYIWGKVYKNLARILGDQLVVWQGVYSERGGK
jgi:uncharacterized protein